MTYDKQHRDFLEDLVHALDPNPKPLLEQEWAKPYIAVYCLAQILRWLIDLPLIRPGAPE